MTFDYLTMNSVIPHYKRDCSTLSEIAKPFEEVWGGGKKMLEILGILNPVANASANKWRLGGEQIGKLTVLFLGLALAIKAVAAAITLFNWASNPLFVVLATLALIISNWEKIKEWWSNPPKNMEAFKAVPTVGSQNYQDYRNNLISQGYVLDENDKVTRLPANVVMENPLYQSQLDIMADVEKQLAQLRGLAENAQVHDLQNKGLMPPTINNNASVTPLYQRQMEDSLKNSGIAVDSQFFKDLQNLQNNVAANAAIAAQNPSVMGDAINNLLNARPNQADWLNNAITVATPQVPQPVPIPPQVPQPVQPAAITPEVTVVNNIPQSPQAVPIQPEVNVQTPQPLITPDIPQAPNHFENFRTELANFQKLPNLWKTAFNNQTIDLANLPDNVNNIDVQMPTQQNAWEAAFSRLQANNLQVPQNTVIDNSVNQIAPAQPPLINKDWENAFNRLQQTEIITPLPPIFVETPAIEPSLQFPNEITSLWKQTPDLWQNALHSSQQNNLVPINLTATSPEVAVNVPPTPVTPPVVVETQQQPKMQIASVVNAITDAINSVNIQPAPQKDEQISYIQNQVQFATPKQIEELIKDYEFVRGQNLNNPEALKELDAHLEILRAALNKAVPETPQVPQPIQPQPVKSELPIIPIARDNNQVLAEGLQTEFNSWLNAFKPSVKYDDNLSNDITSIWRQTPNLWSSALNKLQPNEQNLQFDMTGSATSLFAGTLAEKLQTELSSWNNILRPVSPPPQTQESGQSTQYLIRDNQNQAAMTGNATIGAMNNAEKPVNVNNEVKVEVKPLSQDIKIGEEKIGSICTRFMETHATRLGRNGIMGDW